MDFCRVFTLTILHLSVLGITMNHQHPSCWFLLLRLILLLSLHSIVWRIIICRRSLILGSIICRRSLILRRIICLISLRLQRIICRKWLPGEADSSQPKTDSSNSSESREFQGKESSRIKPSKVSIVALLYDIIVAPWSVKHDTCKHQLPTWTPSQLRTGRMQLQYMYE